MNKLALIALLIGSTSLPAMAKKNRRNPYMFERTPSIIYSLIKRYGFDLDKFLRQRDESPTYFEKCKLHSNGKVIAYDKSGLGTCLYRGFLHKQLNGQHREKAYITTSLYLKESEQSVNATIYWEAPKILQEFRQYKDDIFMHDIAIELEQPVHYSDIYPVGIMLGIDSKFTNATLGQVIVQKVIVKSLRRQDDLDHKVFVMTAYSDLTDEDPIFSVIFNMNYSLFDDEFYLKLDGEIFLE